jgi:hypothetical protein
LQPEDPNRSVDSATGILPRDLKKQGRSFEKELEQELGAWDPGQETVLSLPPCLENRAFDPTGVWHLGRPFDATFLAIGERADQKYRVELWTRGALGEWRMTRQASRQGPALLLDGPVKEYRRVDPFTWIYQIRAGGVDYLVPSAYLDCLMEALGPSLCAAIVDRARLSECVFEREWDGRW